MRKLSDQEKIDIVNKYITEETNCAKLGREYGVNRKTIIRMLRARGIEIRPQSESIRKYSFNRNYFDIIDTEEKAYFLGLLYADGYNYEACNNLVLSLQEEDLEILEKFNKAIESNYKITLVQKRNLKHKNQQKLTICNKHFSENLAKLGCVQAKSLILKFPTEDQVPSHLIRHFIRGYFDGDGSISYWYPVKYKTIKYSVSITSSFDFCETVYNLLQNELSLTIYKTLKNRTSTLTIGKFSHILSFMDWLYEDSTIYLDRKYKKYNSILTIIEEQKALKST